MYHSECVSIQYVEGSFMYLPQSPDFFGRLSKAVKSDVILCNHSHCVTVSEKTRIIAVAL